MDLVVRSWNVFHGNAQPPERHAFLEEMVRLASAGQPDILCLQEVPAWALDRLAGWSGMTALADIAAPPRLGPVPSTAAIGRALTALDHGRLRSAFAGQGNAILVAPGLSVGERWLCVLNPPRFRRLQGRWLGLAPSTRLAWAKERRLCQAVRLAAGAETILVAHLHATSYRADERLADAELLRAATFLDTLSDPGEPILLCGDLNVTYQRSASQAELVRWG
ncbi:MAG: endonuclease/exonuclease/phosphatase family protein, partial [Gaiellaceae bacterium]